MKKPVSTIALSSVAGLLVCLSQLFCISAQAQAPIPDSPAIEAQAHAMLAKLTLEQKVELLGGIESM